MQWMSKLFSFGGTCTLRSSWHNVSWIEHVITLEAIVQRQIWVNANHYVGSEDHHVACWLTSIGFDMLGWVDARKRGLLLAFDKGTQSSLSEAECTTCCDFSVIVIAILWRRWIIAAILWAPKASFSPRRSCDFPCNRKSPAIENIFVIFRRKCVRTAVWLVTGTFKSQRLWFWVLSGQIGNSIWRPMLSRREKGTLTSRESNLGCFISAKAPQPGVNICGMLAASNETWIALGYLAASQDYAQHGTT